MIPKTTQSVKYVGSILAEGMEGILLLFLLLLLSQTVLKIVFIQSLHVVLLQIFFETLGQILCVDFNGCVPANTGSGSCPQELIQLPLNQ